jgi:hypothetical protein
MYFLHLCLDHLDTHAFLDPKRSSDAARAKFAGRVDQTVKIRFARRPIISRRRSFSGLLVKVGFVTIDADVGRGALAVARRSLATYPTPTLIYPPLFTMGASLPRFWRRARSAGTSPRARRPFANANC